MRIGRKKLVAKLYVTGIGVIDNRQALHQAINTLKQRIYESPEVNRATLLELRELTTLDESTGAFLADVEAQRRQEKKEQRAQKEQDKRDKKEKKETRVPRTEWMAKKQWIQVRWTFSTGVTFSDTYHSVNGMLEDMVRNINFQFWHNNMKRLSGATSLRKHAREYMQQPTPFWQEVRTANMILAYRIEPK